MTDPNFSFTQLRYNLIKHASWSHFGPIYNREDVEQMKLELENFNMSFVSPVRVGRLYDEDVE